MSSLLLAFVLLGLGNLISRIKFFLKYKIQGSLISGILGLIFFTFNPKYQNSIEYLNWKDWPGITIALVFSALFLEIREEKSGSGKISEIISQTSFVYVAILGQMLLGVILTFLFFKPIFHLPLSFSSVLENGFAGGHGTAVAMHQAYSDNGLPNGTEYALFSATIGIIAGIVGGIFLVENSHLRKHPIHEEISYDTSFDVPKLFINLGIICLGVFIGYHLKNTVKFYFPDLPEFPLFVYTLLMSASVRKFIILIGKKNIINNSIVGFLSNFFMEILIFTAICTMNLKVINEAILPMLILFSIGFIWNLFCHLVLRKKLLPKEFSFELSIINFGMLNGTTAIGLMLLKMIDPELKSRAVKIYAESAPLTSPVIGGGILTLSLPYLLTKLGAIPIILFILSLILIIYIIGITFNKRLIINSKG